MLITTQRLQCVSKKPLRKTGKTILQKIKQNSAHNKMMQPHAVTNRPTTCCTWSCHWLGRL